VCGLVFQNWVFWLEKFRKYRIEKFGEGILIRKIWSGKNYKEIFD
jgi:hypothetical protein